MKKTWDRIKEVIRKAKTFKTDILKRMAIDGIEPFDQSKITNEFNKFFTEMGPKLTYSIPNSSKDFKQFTKISVTVLHEYAFQDEELEEDFSSLKSDKSSELDDIFIIYCYFLHQRHFSSTQADC